MKKRYAFAFATSLAIGNLFCSAAQAQTAPGSANDPFACQTQKGFLPFCPNVAGKYLSAREALANSQWAEASNFMEQLTQFDKTSREAQELALRTSMLSGRFDFAQDHIDALSAADPGNPLAALAKAAIFVKQGNTIEALESLRASRDDRTADSVLAKAMLRHYPNVVTGNPGKNDAVLFADTLYTVFTPDFVEHAYRLQRERDYYSAKAWVESVPQYQVLISELSLYTNPSDTRPLVDLYLHAKNRGDYMAALHYLDRYPYGEDTPSVLVASAELLDKMGEKPAALQTLYSAAAFFDRKKSEGKELTNADNEAIKSIKRDIDRMQREIAPPAPNTPAP